MSLFRLFTGLLLLITAQAFAVAGARHSTIMGNAIDQLLGKWTREEKIGRLHRWKVDSGVFDFQPGS